MTFIIAFTHHLSSFHPPPSIFITLSSYCPFCTLHSFSVLAVPSIKSLLWCHCPFLSCRCGLFCPLISHLLILILINPPFLCLLSSCNLYPLLSFLVSHFCCSAQFTYGPTFMSESQKTAQTHRYHWHPCQLQSIGTDANSLPTAVEQRQRGQRWKGTDNTFGESCQVDKVPGRDTVGLKQFRKGGLSDRQQPRGQRWWHHMGSWGRRRGAWLSTNHRWKVSCPRCACVCIISSMYIWALCCTSVCVRVVPCMHEYIQDSTLAFMHECVQLLCTVIQPETLNKCICAHAHVITGASLQSKSF